MRPIDATELMEHVWRDKLDSRELIADMVKRAPTLHGEELLSLMPHGLISWQYTKDLNDINLVILNQNNDENWEGLADASQIINITYDTNHGCYVVFWRC